MRCFLALLLLVSTLLTTQSFAANSHGKADVAGETRAMFSDALSPYVVAGCAPTVPASSLTFAAFACTGYVTTTGELLYVDQTAAGVGPLSGGNGTYWLALHRDRTSAVGGWTRQTGTHYLWQLAAVQPANPAGGVVIEQVTVAVAVITAVSEIAPRRITGVEAVTANRTIGRQATWTIEPGGSINLGAGVTLTFGGQLRAPIQTIFTGTGLFTFLGGHRTPAVYPQWWGAVCDGGTTDDTAAFNKATDSVTVWNDGMKRTIIIPGGSDCFIAGTVYVRAGQELRGDGHGVVRIRGSIPSIIPVFRLGERDLAGVPVGDVETGIAPSIQGLHILGGPATAACVFSRFAGYFIRHMQITSCGIAIEADGGDGIISDILIDQGLTGIVIQNAQNLQFNNISIFNANFGVIIASNVYDVQFSNTHIEYVQFAAINFSLAAASIRNVRFDGLQIIQNVQYATILSMVHISTGDVEAVFTNCVFRNMKGFAVINDTGIGARIAFRNCHFDGLKTVPGYDSSTTAGGIETGAMGFLDLTDVDFRNLALQSIKMNGASPTEVLWNGGKIETGIAGYLPIEITNTNASSLLKLGNIHGASKRLYTVQGTVPVVHTGLLTEWFRPAEACGARLCWYIPYVLGTSYQVTVRANVNVGGDGNYRKQSTYGIDKSNDATGGTKTSFIDLTLLHRSAVRDNAVLDVQAEFNTVGSGTSVTPLSNSGVIAISVPNTYTGPTMTAQQVAP